MSIEDVYELIDKFIDDKEEELTELITLILDNLNE